MSLSQAACTGDCMWAPARDPARAALPACSTFTEETKCSAAEYQSRPICKYEDGKCRGYSSFYDGIGKAFDDVVKD